MCNVGVHSVSGQINLNTCRVQPPSLSTANAKRPPCFTNPALVCMRSVALGRVHGCQGLLFPVKISPSPFLHCEPKTWVTDSTMALMREEINSLLTKQATRVVPHPQSGWHSRHFVVPRWNSYLVFYPCWTYDAINVTASTLNVHRNLPLVCFQQKQYRPISTLGLFANHITD